MARSPGVSFGDSLPAATSFPQVINTGATFNFSLPHAIASVISTEGRAFANLGHGAGRCAAASVSIGADALRSRADVLGAQREHVPGPAVGTRAGDSWRGPVPHRGVRGAVRVRNAVG